MLLMQQAHQPGHARQTRALPLLRQQNSLQAAHDGDKGQSSLMATKDSAESIQRLQSIEAALSQLEAQRQQVQSQLFEIDSAMSALKLAKTAFKIVGNVMVDSKPEDVLSELQQKKEILDIRTTSIEKQEQKLRDNAKGIQDQMHKAVGGAQ
jgi:prefoldin beta subunit